MTTHRLSLVVAIVAALVLTGCYRYVHVDPNSVRLHTDASRADIDAGAWPITISFMDATSDLLDLRPLPGTAFVWNDTFSLPLAVGGTAFDGRSPYDPRDGKVRTISFYMQPEKATAPLKPGAYNISMQLNGVAGIHTVCGSFRIVSEIRQINGNDLH